MVELCPSFVDTLSLSLYWPANVVVSGLDVSPFSLLLDSVLYIPFIEYDDVLSIPLVYKYEYEVSLV